MTNLEALARFLAANPADTATLAAFVDLLKDAEPERAMESIRLLLDTRDAWHRDILRVGQPEPGISIPSTPPPEVVPSQPEPLYWREAVDYLEAARRRRERDKAAGRLFWVRTTRTSADPLEGL